MHSYLRQSTAAQSRSLGPFIDDTDFKTEETGLTIANTDIKLMINGAASANKNSGGGTHRANGVYGVTFDATDTATVGEMFVSVKVAGALAVFATFVVVEEAVYDAYYAASATGLVGTAQTGDSFARIGAPVGASISADVAAVKAQTAAIETDTQDIQTRLPAALVSGRIDASVGAMAANTMTAAAAAADLTTELQSGLATAASITSLDGKIDTIDNFLDTEIAAIKAKTDSLTFTVANQLDANVQSINDVTITGDGQLGTEFGV